MLKQKRLTPVLIHTIINDDADCTALSHTIGNQCFWFVSRDKAEERFPATVARLYPAFTNVVFEPLPK